MADSPTDSESAQALFCAIADFVGTSDVDKVLNLKLYPTYRDFKIGSYKDKPIQELITDALSYINTHGVTGSAGLTRMELLLKKQGWYNSSVLTARKLIKFIHTIDMDFKDIKDAGWDDFVYVRGGKGGTTTMDNIEKLYKIANKNDNQFGDINKWSPADIYFVSDMAKDLIEDALEVANQPKSGYDFDDLNQLINALLKGGKFENSKGKTIVSKGGQLLPLSLKKVIGEAATIHKYNFFQSKESAYFQSIKFEKVQSQGVDKNTRGIFKIRSVADLNKFTSAPTFSATRDLKLYFKAGGKSGGNIKIRHTPHHTKFGVNEGVKFEIEQKGAGGRLGQFVGIGVMAKLLDKGYANCELTSDVVDAAREGFKNYKNAINDLNATYQVPIGYTTSKELYNAIAKRKQIKYRPLTASDSHNLLAIQKSTWRETDFKNVKAQSKKPSNHMGQNLYQEYQIKRMHLSGIHFDNKVYPVIAKYFTTESNYKCSKVIKVFIKYAASRSDKSGMFVITK